MDYLLYIFYVIDSIKVYNMKYINEFSGECGIYCIRNLVNNHLYIGSSIMLTKRYKEHRLKLSTNKHHCIILQNAINKYGIDNFEFVVLKTYDNISDRDLRFTEGMLIRLFKSEYNICKYPEVSGKPNYKRKLDKEWIYNLHKDNNYKHTNNVEIYNKVVEKNKNTATHVILIKDSKKFKFTTVKEACLFLGLKSNSTANLIKRCNKLNYTFNIISTQKRKVQIIEPNNTIRIFNSAGECDRYYHLWRGCTSNAICHLQGKLFENYAAYI